MRDKANDISPTFPTNVISITDADLPGDRTCSIAGVRPAINGDRSVFPVGGNPRRSRR